MRVGTKVLCALLLVSPAQAFAVCQGGKRIEDFAGKRIVLAQDALFFKTASIQLDLDGSPKTYGVRDQGLDHICNGLGPLKPPECKGKVKGECFTACETAFRTWVSKGAHDPKTLKTWMCAIGLGGGHCSEPDVRLQAAPDQDWFVSETSVHPAPPKGTTVSAWVKIQPAQLDLLRIQYFVIPGGFRSEPWDATPGDVGVLMDGPNGKPIPFIVGDTGGALNEGSAALLASVRGIDALPTQTKTSALGTSVERMKGAKDGDFRVVIFRHTAPLLPPAQRGNRSVLDKSAEELPSWIQTTAVNKLNGIGGAARIAACTN